MRSRTTEHAPAGRAVPASSLAEQVLEDERRLLRALGTWASGSVAAGLLLGSAARRRGRPSRRPGDDVLTGFARQTVGWGAVDAAIVVRGRRGLRSARRGGLGDDEALRRAARLGRITAVNALLDLGYVAVGAALARRPGRWRGDGLAVVVQGLALLLLDARHASAARRLTSSVPDRAPSRRP